jgi:hypothetical protein
VGTDCAIIETSFWSHRRTLTIFGKVPHLLIY